MLRNLKFRKINQVLQGKLSRKIFGMQVLSLALILLPLMIFQFIEKREQLKIDFKRGQIERLNSLEVSLEIPLWNFATQDIDRILEANLDEGSVVKVVLRDEGGQIIGQKERPFDQEGTVIRGTEINYKGQILGDIVVTFSEAIYDQILKEFAIRELIIVGLMFLVLLIVNFYLIEEILIRPIKFIRSRAQAIGQGQLGEARRWVSDDELGQLSQEIEGMRVRLKALLNESMNNNEKLKEFNDKLQETVAIKSAQVVQSAKLASLGEMSAGIAHEINNPLGVIMGNLPLLVKFKDDEVRFRGKIEVMQKSGQRIEKIVKGLKKFSRQSAGQDFKIESLNAIISEANVITETKFIRNATELDIEVKENLFIYGDALEIEQVIVNLLNNAVDAIKNQEDRWVKILGFEEDNSIVLQVIDSGPGISPEVEQKLFQPFFTTKAVGEGTGLGLSITKGILDNHNASFKINHQFNNTCFEIRFPKVESIVNREGGYAA